MVNQFNVMQLPYSRRFRPCILPIYAEENQVIDSHLRSSVNKSAGLCEKYFGQYYYAV